MSYKKYEEFGGLTIFLLKSICKFRGKKLKFEKFGGAQPYRTHWSGSVPGAWSFFELDCERSMRNACLVFMNNKAWEIDWIIPATLGIGYILTFSIVVDLLSHICSL